MKDPLSRRQMLALGGTVAAGALTGACRTPTRPHGAALGATLFGIAGAHTAGKYALPPLPYGYDALAPLYEERTVRIHHDKHHAGYVRGLNATLDKLTRARESKDYGAVKALSRDLAFHGSGHVLHTLFWHSMTPGGTKMPDSLARRMKTDFGSVETAQAQFAAATKQVEGSGWGVLAYEPIGKQLMILQAEKHQNLTVWGVVPLLVCDVWEHAYYLQFANARGDWVANFMKLANWKFAADRLAAAMA